LTSVLEQHENQEGYLRLEHLIEHVV